MAHGAATKRTQPVVALPPEKLRWIKILYAGIFMCFLFSHVDVGVLSQSNDKVIDTMVITEGKMGLLETGLYIGIVAGTIICPILFSVMSPKTLISLASLLNGLFAVVIVIGSENTYWIVFGSRVLVGLFLVRYHSNLPDYSRFSSSTFQYGSIYVRHLTCKPYGSASSI